MRNAFLARSRGGCLLPGLGRGLGLLVASSACSQEGWLPPTSSPRSPASVAQARDGQAIPPSQNQSRAVPPKSPAIFNPDPPTSAPPRLPEPTPVQLQLSTSVSSSLPLAPSALNPDPTPPEKSRPSLYNFEFQFEAPYGSEPIDPQLALPRAGVRTRAIVEGRLPDTEHPYGHEPVPSSLEPPRQDVVLSQRHPAAFRNPSYPLAVRGLGFPAYSEPVTNRWQIEFTPWRRYASGDTETPYRQPTPRLWHPYQQSLLKGDLPIYRQDIFLNLTAGGQTEFEARRIPVRTRELVGQSEQWSLQQSISFAAELFKGETVFRPADWSFRLEPVLNAKHVGTSEEGLVYPPAPGTTPGPFQTNSDTTRLHLALQEASFDVHLRDLSVNYDFLSLKSGIQPFISDFRGFVFNDTNLGLRLYGNAANNLYQYNLAVFDLLEKDPFSDLNKFSRRDQQVVVANLYRQDFLTPGYTTEWSVHASFDHAASHPDLGASGSPVGPNPGAQSQGIETVYLGWAGNGHIGRVNLTHAFYQVLGHDEYNALAGRATDIQAQLAALELSLDQDWIRYKLSLLYASGDGDAHDGVATGFDSILDNAFFAGSAFSYFSRQGLSLVGSAPPLKPRNTFLPDFRSSKGTASANFVNPGLLLTGAGMDLELTPKTRATLHLGYLHFADTDSIQALLGVDTIDPEIGWDLGLGMQYRPFLTDNLVVTLGLGALIPGRGYREIYQQGLHANRGGGASPPDDLPCSAMLAVTFTY